MNWARRKDSPEGEDLKELYKAIVCPNCGALALAVMSSGEMIKGICRAAYFLNLDKIHKWQLVYYLSLCFGMKERAVESYLPSRTFKHVNVRQLDEIGRVIMTFDNIPHAAQQTGIAERLIYQAVQQGCRTGGYYYKADNFVPEI